MSTTAKNAEPSAAGANIVRSAAGLRVRSPVKLPSGWKPKRLDLAGFPDRASGQGGPPPTIANVKHLLDENGIEARYDVIKKKTEIVIPNLPGVIDNGDNVSIAHVKSLMALHGMQNGDARAIIDAIANQNPYNPVANWIRSKPWDGVDRLPDFYATLHTVEDYPPSLKEAIMYCWSLSAVAAALMPSGFSTRLVLTLQGPQSIGKTRWCLSLVSDALLRGAVVKTDHHFDGGAKDNVITAARYWIVELGEVESSFRKDQERLKGILTRDRDVIRLPYAAADSEFPRRTVFLASANGADFLSDPTGSTRWGVIAVQSIDYEHDVDMQQLFAQQAEAFDRGEKWWFTPEQEAQLEAWNERHQTTSVIRDTLASVVDFEGDCTQVTIKMTATELLRAADIPHPTAAQARECGGILRKAFGPPKKGRGIYRWDIPTLAEVPPDKLPTPPVKDKFD